VSIAKTGDRPGVDARVLIPEIPPVQLIGVNWVSARTVITVWTLPRRLVMISAPP
jgi:hypothetical protein